MPILLQLSLAALLLALSEIAHSVALSRMLRDDVAAGVRGPMALRDDYGSARGSWWPWGALAAVTFVLADVAILWAAIALTIFVIPAIKGL